MRVRAACVWSLAVFVLSSLPAGAQDVVLHATDVTVIRGNWTRLDATGAASSKKMASTNHGWSTPDAPLASPTDYFEASFTVQAWKPYRLWLRLRASGDTKWNESVWVQFTNAVDSGGDPAYRIGTGKALLVNLEDCNACGVSGWGWSDGAYWLSRDTSVEFSTAGTQTIRVQTREDGVEIDQIVLSPSTYISAPPGGTRNDTTILARAGAAAAPTPTTTPTTTTTTAVNTSTKAIPGTIQAEDFNSGANGTAYYDKSPGNYGGKYRATDVDIETTGDSGGGYNVAWIGAGEWLKYSVNVGSAGTYKLTARVASPASGGRLHVEFNGSNKTGAMSVPNTGGWQSYRDVTAQFTLAAGAQTMRIVFDTNASNGAVGNINYVKLAKVTTTTTDPAPTSGKVRVMTWNIHFGKTASNVYDSMGQARVMANSGAHIILLQEAQTWDEDQPKRFPEMLQQLTGYTWRSVWSPNNTSGGGSQGTLILTRLPIVNSSTAIFENASMARALITVKSGVNAQFFNSHLEYYDKAKRTRQLAAFMAWADNYAGPTIAGGDYNSWWGESWIKTMETQYSDTWQDVTGSDQNGYTHNNIRFDYLFRSFLQNWRLTPTACWVISTDRSDHRPLVADYTVR